MIKGKAYCIKTGIMRNGTIFCKEGEVYPYKKYEDRPPHDTCSHKVETLSSKNHYMAQKFFNEYFTEHLIEWFTDEDLCI